MGVGSFTSTFGKKAHADLISYEGLRAKRAREIDELYTRPFEDFVVEEFISNLPGPTIEELDVPMEQAGGSADAAPADSPSGEMAGVEEAKPEPDSATPMDVDVPMDTDVPEGSSSGEVSGTKAEEPERLGSHRWCILMILTVRNLPAQNTRVTREALHLERHPYRR